MKLSNSWHALCISPLELKSSMFLLSTYSAVPLCSCMVSIFRFAGQQTPHNSPLDDWPRVNYLHAYIRSLVVALRYFSFYFHFQVRKLKGCAHCLTIMANCVRKSNFCILFLCFWHIDRSGLNVKGYFVWSFLDAFELLVGYESSYGLYYIDRNDPNLRRQPKLSAEWYSNFLKGKLMDTKITKETEKNASVLSHNPSLHSATQSNQNTFEIQSE